MTEPRCEYVRQLEDAVLVLWAEMPTKEAKELALDVPAMWEFCAHLHQHVEHEQAMVRRNVWADPSGRSGGPDV